MKRHSLVIAGGTLTAIYSDELDVPALGQALGTEPVIERASDVEWTPAGWVADMVRSGGPRLPSCAARGDALAAEVAWLQESLGMISVRDGDGSL